MRLAVVLGVLALVVAVSFAGLTAMCGLTEVPATMEGERGGSPQCVSYLHPLAPVFAGGALVAVAGLLTRRHWLALASGLVLLPVAVLGVFSLGLFGLSVAGLLILAGLTAKQRAAARPGAA